MSVDRPSRILPIIEETSAEARAFVARHKTNRDGELYRILVNCLRIAEICLADREEAKTLDKLFAEMPRPKSHNRRRYVERESDIYQRVARYVFRGEAHRANVNRYAICLREAAKRNVVSGQLFDALMKKGGVARFYLGRPNLQDWVSTRAIRLETPINHAKNAVVTLELTHVQGTLYAIKSVEIDST